MELIVVLAVFCMALGIATPSVLKWRKNLYYSQASRNFTTVLRQARSSAMSSNRQHYVVFKPYSSGNNAFAYRLIKRSVDPTNTVFTNYSCLQKSGTNVAVTIKGTTASPMANIGFTFNPNGTALLSYPSGATNDGNVGIYDGSTQVYLVTVTKTGRVASAHAN
jgi:Tfp pilus assembly protein FimT